MYPSDDLVRLLARTFIARRDVKAVQQSNGAYHPEHSKWTIGDLRDHITGERSLGHYTVNSDGKTKLFAFDIDLDNYGTWEDLPLCERPDCQKPHIPPHNFHPREVWAKKRSDPDEVMQVILMQQTFRAQFRAIGEGLASRITRNLTSVKSAIAYSGSKGIHVYGFTGDEEEANDVRALALEILSSHTYHQVRGDNFWKHDDEFPHFTIEVFPKQDKVRDGDGLGNLMRLPLGRNMKGGKAFFLDPAAQRTEFEELDPMEAMLFGIFDTVKRG